MSTITGLVDRVFGKLIGFPPATVEVDVERDLTISLPDGPVLLADRWYPIGLDSKEVPILLARTPYGRSELIGRTLAARGYQVVLVRSRGTFGSGGDWQAFHHEQSDGKTVLEWLPRQPWFSGRVGLYGASYHGLTQWAVSGELPPWVRSVSPAVTSTNFRKLFYPGGSFALESALSWTYALENQESSRLRGLVSTARRRKRLAPAFNTLPLADADRIGIGHHVNDFQNWLSHDAPDDPWWQPIDFSDSLSAAPPTNLVAGWYDVFLLDQLDDAKSLIAANRSVRLTVGPWSHTSPGGFTTWLRETLDWADLHLRGRTRAADVEVRVFVMGLKRWVSLPTWPPPATATSWYLQPGGGLSPHLPPASQPDRYTYDPTNPTPGNGGATLERKNAGAKDNRQLECRADVLTFTSEELRNTTTLIGELTAVLFVRSTSEHTDFFVRLCDVDTKGRSTNRSDGIIRLQPKNVDRQKDGTLAITIRMFPTATAFAPGHRIRIQVSSGAHPIYARNPGSGEPLGNATRLVVSHQEIFHDPEHPSHIVLPVTTTPLLGVRQP